MEKRKKTISNRKSVNLLAHLNRCPSPLTGKEAVDLWREWSWGIYGLLGLSNIFSTLNVFCQPNVTLKLQCCLTLLNIISGLSLNPGATSASHRFVIEPCSVGQETRSKHLRWCEPTSDLSIMLSSAKGSVL